MDLFQFPNTEIALKNYANFLVNEYKNNLERDGHKASGKLISSIQSVVNVGDNSFSVELHLEDYWKYVEHGRMAGKFPPIKNILEWIKIKPVLPRPDANGKLPTEEQLAFLIARKIANEGIEKGGELMEAKVTADNFYLGEIENALTTDLEEHFTSIISMLIV